MVEGWKNYCLKEIIDELIMGQSPDSSSYNNEEKGIAFIQGNADMQNGVPSIRMFTTDPKRYSELNDILLSVRAPVGDVFYNNYGNLSIGRGLSAIRIKNKHLRTLVYYWLNFDKKQFERLEQGTTFTEIGKKEVRNINVTIPTNSKEQASIANILSSVDEAIESVKKSIDAAEKLKKSLMQNLLTGRMKPDGTLRTEEEFYEDEKFGKVPIGWEVKAIGDKKVCQINPVYKYKRKEIYDFIPMEAVKERFGGLDYVEKQLIDNGSYTRFKAGDILFAKITPCSENGKVAYIEHIDSEVGFASTEFIVFHPTDEVNGRYIYLLLTSENIHRLAISLMEGTTGRQRIPWKIFKNRIFVPLPCKEEQTNIVNRILVFDKQINNYYNRINILETLKKSLMQNLLTGKVRVGEEGKYQNRRV